MTIHFVTGATGFVGKYLSEGLLSKGDQVWILVRTLNGIPAQERAKAFVGDLMERWPDTLRVVEGDILSEGLGVAKGILEELSRQDTVVFWHLAANLSFATANKQDVHVTNLIGTQHAVTFANRYAQRFVHMSTAYVCGDATSFTESDLNVGQSFRNQYERSKFEAECHVHDHCAIPYTVFRPSIIIGDAYQGKAEGCTFGYYRYTFMFYFLRKNMTRVLETNTLFSRVLKVFGCRSDPTNSTVSAPVLIVPYPKNGLVDLIGVDYVIEAMLALYENNGARKAIHLTHSSPPEHGPLLDAILHDIGFRDYRILPVPPRIFALLARVLFIVIVPVRKYVRSVMWYIPYVTTSCRFDRATVRGGFTDPPRITRAVIKKINTYAKEHILEHIEI